MKHKFIIFLVILSVGIGLFIWRNEVEKQAALENSQVVDIKTTYAGLLPCADCSGIETTLTFINANQDPDSYDGTFTMTETYQGKDVKPFVTKGNWTIIIGTPTNEDATVYKLTSTNPDTTEYYLQVDNTHIKQLDNNLEEIDSPFNMTLTKEERIGLPNPASVNCETLGGTLEMKKDSNGNEYSMCHLKNGEVCEEWALFQRGKCEPYSEK